MTKSTPSQLDTLIHHFKPQGFRVDPQMISVSLTMKYPRIPLPNATAKVPKSFIRFNIINSDSPETQDVLSAMITYKYIKYI